MEEREFDVLEELYFLIHYDQLKRALRMNEDELREALTGLFSKGFIRCYQSPVHELFDREVQLERDFRSYYYLASKEGLMIRHGAK